MRTGELIASRFQLGELVGRGGMGAVYRARDLSADKDVALKVLLGTEPDWQRRLAREGRILAALDHPVIVRYVAHGTTEDGSPFLAMEWLEGEDLAQRLARSRLDVDESIQLAWRAAQGLAAVHARGVLHRDLKPSNLFLEHGRIESLRMLDFGLARMPALSLSASGGGVIGTVGYVSPEQARGDREVSPAADVFSLGVVLFESLAGRRAFDGDHMLAVLARIMFEEPERIGEVRDDVPEALEALLTRMLAKDPGQRPADGTALVAALGPLVEAQGRHRVAPRPAPAGLTTGEVRIVSVVTACAGAAAFDPAANCDRLRVELAPFGARVERLGTDALLIVMSGGGLATDRVAQSARCALRVRAILPDARLALATGRARLGGRLPVGEPVQRALQMLSAGPPGGPVRIDATSVGLMDARFDIGGDDGGLTLDGEVEVADVSRRVLGRPTPFVGRRRELNLMLDAAEGTIEDRAPAVVLVTGPAGAGKSRLRQEFLTRLAEWGHDADIWLGRADSLSTGAPFGMIGSLLRSAAGVRIGQQPAVMQAKLAARMARCLKQDDVERLAPFVGEMAGIRFSDADRAALRAARSDPRLMAEQMRQSFGDWLAAETAERPLLLVLEDVHWGDVPSVRAIDLALRRLHDRPVMVAAFGRPDVYDTFPGLWSEHGGHVVRLGELRPADSVRLARAVVADSLDDARIEALVRRSAGNPFMLEELLRRASEDPNDAPPETVLAMVQARIETLDPHSRRLLRAASIFGEEFWSEGVAALVEPIADGGAADPFRRLIDSEIVDPRTDPRFDGCRELAFRHALLREAAYAALTDEDRVLGHRLAGEWLESIGETDATTLAVHFENGGSMERAGHHYLRAAEQALVGNDLDGTMRATGRAIACGLQGVERAEVLLVQARVHMWRGDHAAEGRLLREALGLLAPDDHLWPGMARQALQSFAAMGERDAAVRLLDDVFAVEGKLAWSQRAALLARAAETSLFLGLGSQDRRAMDLLEDLDPAVFEHEPHSGALVYQMRSHGALTDGAFEDAIVFAQRSCDLFAAAGNRRSAVVMRGTAGYVQQLLGLLEEADRELNATLDEARNAQLTGTANAVQHNLGWVRALEGRLDEGRTMEQNVLAGPTVGRLRVGASIYLARIECMAGRLDEAERAARTAIDESRGIGPLHCYAMAVLGDIFESAGRDADALAVAESAAGLREEIGGIDEGDALLDLVLARALRGTGRVAQAQEVVRLGTAALEARSARIRDPGTRAAFRSRVPEHAALQSLAEALGVDAAPDRAPLPEPRRSPAL
jgi:eukaryotic-like serine/threonine-protein kinase